MMDKNICDIVESICEQGCQSVNKKITQLQNNETCDETSNLDASEKQIVLKELITIMQVYDK